MAHFYVRGRPPWKALCWLAFLHSLRAATDRLQQASGTIAHYSFDGGFQNDADPADYASRGVDRHVRLQSSGIDGPCAYFDGSAEVETALDIGSNALLDSTVAAWVKPDALSLDRQTTSRIR